MEEIRIEDIGEILRNRIKGYEKEIETSEVGTIISVGDGIARAYGLDQVMAGNINEITDSLIKSEMEDRLTELENA